MPDAHRARSLAVPARGDEGRGMVCVTEYKPALVCHGGLLSCFLGTCTKHLRRRGKRVSARKPGTVSRPMPRTHPNWPFTPCILH